MGRTEPTVVLPPRAFRRASRAKRARVTINKTIPSLLSSTPRARRGIDAAELIAEPPPSATLSSSPSPKHQAKPVKLRLQVTDTLSAARALWQSHHATPNNAQKSGNRHEEGERKVGILSMASELRPGGGFLNGATSQEEFLCMRSTLYPSLLDQFYRLPDTGGIWTPDVLIFRSSDADAKDLAKADRFFVDVVSAGMLRYAELEEDSQEGGKKTYANPRDREMVERKMRAVMRIFEMKGVRRIVLGAWGCGAFGNPVLEVAKCWRKVLLPDMRDGEGKRGSKRDKRNAPRTEAETWAGIWEVVFAVNDRRMAEEFTDCFGDGLEAELPTEDTAITRTNTSSKGIEELEAKITETEGQIRQVRNQDLKARLEEVILGLKTQLAETKGILDTSDEDGEASSPNHPIGPLVDVEDDEGEGRFNEDDDDGGHDWQSDACSFDEDYLV